jgi:ribosomal protein S18 acetylase RimI-like enzyme
MQLEDLAGVFELGCRLFRPDRLPTLYRCWDESDILKLYENHKETCLVAADSDERILGFALGSVMEKPGSAWRYGWLEWLGVDPFHKRLRIAQRLIGRLQDRLVEKQVRIMLVDTDEGNRSALALFHKLGFGQELRHVFLSLNLETHPRVLERRFDNETD